MLLAPIAAVAAFASADGAGQVAHPVRVPRLDNGVDALVSRAADQRRNSARELVVPADFTFVDRLPESGITFVHRTVDDAGPTYKAAHYDHGTGLAVADVEGDGREDLYFVNQLGGNQLWSNDGGGRFHNITGQAGVSLADRVSVGASFADIDNDGDQDLFVTTVRGGNALFENDGHGRFRDISSAAGVAYTGHSSGAAFFDYDNDGLLDLYVSNVGRYTHDEKGRGGAYVALADAFSGHLHGDRTERSILYRNLGGNRFVDVTTVAGLLDLGWNGDTAAADLNADGFPDLYALNMQGADRFLENRGGRTFVERTSAYFPKTPWGSMGIKFFDYDNDGQRDLFVTDMHSDMSVIDPGNGPLAIANGIDPRREKEKVRPRWREDFLGGPAQTFIFGNALYHNLGAPPFEEVSDQLGVETYWPWGPSVGDVNADGWQDLFITGSMNYPYRYGINSLLLNNRGRRFVDSEFLLGIEPRRDGRTYTSWFEIDCSVRDSPCQGQAGRATIMAPLGSRSSAIFDVDQDGDLDIVTNDFNSPPQVFVSDLAQRRPIRWLAVIAMGMSSNTNAIGATVRVYAGSRVLTQWIDGKSGYLSQGVLPLYFGLGDEAAVDRIEVDWPSGRTQVVMRPQLNVTIRIIEQR